MAKKKASVDEARKRVVSGLPEYQVHTLGEIHVFEGISAEQDASAKAREIALHALRIDHNGQVVIPMIRVLRVYRRKL